MAKHIATCKAKQNGQFLELLSPSVGRAKVMVEIGQRITAKNPVAEFFQLNRRIMLFAPDNCVGLVTARKNSLKIIDLMYDEPFLTIDKSEGLSQTIANEILALGRSIDAPMDGMFYLSSSPETPAFVKVGDKILPGQTLGLIEVMKCFYPLQFQGLKPATISKIVVKNATAVNYGTPIFEIMDE